MNATEKTAAALEPTAKTETVLGYRVEINPDWSTRTIFPVPYFLHGPRGAHYGLARNAHNPTMLFVVNLRSFRQVNAKGYTWFHEDGENLVPVN